MSRRLLLAAAATTAAGLIACKPLEGLECGDNRCTETQLCDEATHLCVNNVAPVITVESPAPGSLHKTNVIQIRGTIIDDEGQVTHAEASGDEGRTWVPIDLTSDGTFSQSLPIAARNFAPLKVLFRSRDRLELTSETSVEITVDTLGPACTFISPADGMQIGADAPAVYEIQVSAIDPSGPVQNVALSIDGTTLPSPQNSGGTFTWNFPLPPEANGISEHFRFTAADVHGNTCVLERDVIIDRIIPMLSVGRPAEDGYIWRAADTRARILGAASDGDGAPPKVGVDFGDGQGERLATVEDNGAWHIDIDLPEIDHTPRIINVRAYDSAGNAVTATRKAAVDRVAPRIVITSPTEGQLLGNAQLDQNGAVKVTWSVEDASPETTPTAVTFPTRDVVLGPGTAVFGTQSTDNPQTYKFELSVLDQAGNKGTLTRTIQVDRIGPTASFDRANNSRRNPHSLQITFSEPVTEANASALSLSPAVTPTISPTAYTYALEADTVYTATLAPGAFLDAAGNANTDSATIKFHTAPAQPTQTTLLSNVEHFDAASDLDGAVLITARQTSPSRTYLGFIDTRTGALVMDSEQTHLISTGSEPIAAAWSQVDSISLTATRIRAWREMERFNTAVPTYSTRIWWKSGSGPLNTISRSGKSISRMLPVAVPPGCSDPQGLSEVGSVTNDLYERLPSLSETMSVDADAVMAASGNSLSIIDASTSSLRMQERYCSCFVTACQWRSVSTVDAAWAPTSYPSFSGVAFPEVRQQLSFYPGGWVFQATDGNNQRYEYCVGPCTTTCPSPVKRSRPQEGYFAKNGSGKLFLEARSSNGTIRLFERDLAAAGVCSTDGKLLGTLNVQATLKGVRPVMFGLKPGVIYLEGTTLKAWIP